MLENDFYPTPKELALHLVRPYMNKLRDIQILEPSAGSGSIVDAISEAMTDQYSFRRSPVKDNITTLEIDPDLRATLIGKEYRVAGSDFMTYSGSGIYFGLIIMNPPFSSGVDHVLHAWDILHDGDLAAILPSEVFRNPYSRSRVLLSDLVAKHGTVEHVGSAFSQSERPTDVEVCIVRLSKADDGRLEGLFSGIRVNNRAGEDAPDINTNQVIQHSEIGGLVDSYTASLEAYKAAFKALYELSYYGEVFGNNLGVGDYQGHTSHRGITEAFCQSLEHLSPDSMKGSFRSCFNGFVRELTGAAWRTVFERTNMSKHMTNNVKKEFQKLESQQASMEFSPENIYRLLDTIVMNTGRIGESAIVESFDLMTRYHKENRVHIEGWKTNEAWRVNRKVILPSVIDWSFKNPRVSFSRSSELDDIDRGLCFLEGKTFGCIRTVRMALEEACNDLVTSGIQSEFFSIRYYHKGTAHLTFLEESVWERFNAAACHGKNWLPPA